jgi:hypothetical protein
MEIAFGFTDSTCTALPLAGGKRPSEHFPGSGLPTERPAINIMPWRMTVISKYSTHIETQPVAAAAREMRNLENADRL